MYQIIIVVATSIIISFLFILYLLENQKYKMNKKSIVEEEAEKLYINDYKLQNISDLERQIRIVTKRFINFKDCNRYTLRLVNKAKKDKKIDKIKNLLLEEIKILKYRNNKLKTKVKFQNANSEYFLLMKMKTVFNGRIFLKSYKILENRIKIKEETL